VLGNLQTLLFQRTWFFYFYMYYYDFRWVAVFPREPGSVCPPRVLSCLFWRRASWD